MYNRMEFDFFTHREPLDDLDPDLECDPDLADLAGLPDLDRELLDPAPDLGDPGGETADPAGDLGDFGDLVGLLLCVGLPGGEDALLLGPG